MFSVMSVCLFTGGGSLIGQSWGHPTTRHWFKLIHMGPPSPHGPIQNFSFMTSPCHLLASSLSSTERLSCKR